MYNFSTSFEPLSGESRRWLSIWLPSRRDYKLHSNNEPKHHNIVVNCQKVGKCG